MEEGETSCEHEGEVAGKGIEDEDEVEGAGVDEGEVGWKLRARDCERSARTRLLEYARGARGEVIAVLLRVRREAPWRPAVQQDGGREGFALQQRAVALVAVGRPHGGELVG